MKFLDSTVAVIPPMEGDFVPGQYTFERLADSGTNEAQSRKLKAGRTYLLVAVTAVRLSFRHESGVSNAVTTSSFFLPAGTLYVFKAVLGPDRDWGSIYVYAGSPNDSDAFEAQVIHADR